MQKSEKIEKLKELRKRFPDIHIYTLTLMLETQCGIRMTPQQVKQILSDTQK